MNKPILLVRADDFSRSPFPIACCKVTIRKACLYSMRRNAPLAYLVVLNAGVCLITTALSPASAFFDLSCQTPRLSPSLPPTVHIRQDVLDSPKS